MPKKSTIRKIVGIDLSLTGTGLAKYVNPFPDVVMDPINFRTLSPPKDVKNMNRLDWILTNVCVHTQYADFVVFEDLAFAAHDRNHERAGLACLIRHALWKQKIPYILVAPTSLKKFTSGSGKAEKSKMMLEVFKKWKHDPANDNEGDAIALLYVGRAICGLDINLDKAQKEVLKTVTTNNQEALTQLGL